MRRAALLLALAGCGAAEPAQPAATQAPSCAGAAPLCRGESCCATRAVPGGTFPMGRGRGTDAFAEGEPSESPEHPATVSAFLLDRYEVTVGRFRAFVDAGAPLPIDGAGAHPRIAGSGWQRAWDDRVPSGAALREALACDPRNATWTDTADAQEALPINCVTYHLAFAFCAWDGGRLPTEAEWELAAAGGRENRLYPWGAAPPPSRAVAAMGCLRPDVEDCTLDDLPAVGSHPRGDARWGHADLGGSLLELVLDAYSASWYQDEGATCTDCARLGDGPTVRRGGNYRSDARLLRAAHRYYDVPDGADTSTGFRCAR